MKLAFAKDIDFVKTGTTDKGPEHFEEKLKQYAHATKKEFKGFILPYVGGETRALFVDTKGRESMPKLHGVLACLKRLKHKSPENYRNHSIGYISRNKELLVGAIEKSGYKFRGFIENNTKATFYCAHHDKISIRYVYDIKHNGYVYCDDCLKVLRAANVGFYNNMKGYATSSASIYIQSLSGKYGKYGTSKNPHIRMQTQSRLSNFEHEMIFTHEFKDGWKALDLEEGLRTNFDGKKAPKKDLPDGHTETFKYSLIDDVMKFVRDYIALNPSRPVYLKTEDEFWSQIGSDFELDESTLTFPETNDDEYYNNLSELDLSPLETL